MTPEDEPIILRVSDYPEELPAGWYPQRWNPIPERLPERNYQFGQVPPDHPGAAKPVPWGQHPYDCDCGDCP